MGWGRKQVWMSSNHSKINCIWFLLQWMCTLRIVWYNFPTTFCGAILMYVFTYEKKLELWPNWVWSPKTRTAHTQMPKNVGLSLDSSDTCGCLQVSCTSSYPPRHTLIKCSKWLLCLSFLFLLSSSKGSLSVRYLSVSYRLTFAYATQTANQTFFSPIVKQDAES